MIDIMEMYNQACTLEEKRDIAGTALDLLLSTLPDEEIDQLIDAMENRPFSVV